VHKVTITPEVSKRLDGAVQSVYRLPDGSVYTVITPPASFHPLTASAKQLAEYNFPPIPQDEAAAQDWRAAMSLFKSAGTPPGAVQIEVGSEPQFTQYGLWGGYIVGTELIQSHTYVAVKGVFTVRHYDGNTAEWVMEAPKWYSPNFGSVKFTDANAELSSTSSWVSLGSQSTIRAVQGSSSSYYCIAPEASVPITSRSPIRGIRTAVTERHCRGVGAHSRS